MFIDLSHTCTVKRNCGTSLWHAMGTLACQRLVPQSLRDRAQKGLVSGPEPFLLADHDETEELLAWQ